MTFTCKASPASHCESAWKCFKILIQLCRTKMIYSVRHQYPNTWRVSVNKGQREKEREIEWERRRRWQNRYKLYISLSELLLIMEDTDENNDSPGCDAHQHYHHNGCLHTTVACSCCNKILLLVQIFHLGWRG